MSTTTQSRPPPHQPYPSPPMNDLFDFAGYDPASSDSSPLQLPPTPEFDATASTDFFKVFGSSTGLESSKDVADPWSSYEQWNAPSLFAQSAAEGATTTLGAIDGFNAYSSQFPTASAGAGSSANGGSLGQVFGSPPLSASSPSSSPSSFALEQTDSTASPSLPIHPSFGDPGFAIDPQLAFGGPSPVDSIPRTTVAPTAATPAAPKPTAAKAKTSAPLPTVSRVPPPPGSYDEGDDDEDDEDDDDQEMKSVSRGDSLPPIGKANSSNGGAKGGANARRSASGIVQSGGITKQRVTSAVVALDKDPNDTEDWRPTPEEYKKLSSKEKRQLRNKISARNFRVRRKEYITTLESHIADRDRLIDAIRNELGQSKVENDELRQEVDALKRAMLEGRTTIESLALPPPAPLDANGDVIHPISPPTPSATASRKLNKPNVRKDIAPTQGSPAFWAGTHGFGGGVTPVHATLVPDITLPATAQARNLAASAPLAASASASASAITSELLSGKMSGWWAHSAEQENLNPLMNIPPPLTAAQQQVQEERELARLNSSLLGGMGMSRFDAFMELNPFTIKSAEDYRMQLWAQMAASRQQQQYFAQQGQQGQQPQQRFAQPTYAKAQQSNTTATASGSLLSQAPRAPLFFSSPTSPAGNTPASSPQSPKSTLAALLAGKPVGSSSSSSSKTAYPSPPTSPRASHARPITIASSNAHNNNTPTQQQAMVAALASQTLLSRMGSAFWEAFSGSSTSSGSTGSTTRVGGGAQRPSWDAEKVRKVLEGRAVLRVVDVEPPAVSVINEKVFVDEGLGLGLEEKMKSLSIGGERHQERCAAHAQMERDRCAEAAAKTIAEGTGVFMNLRK